MSDANEPTLTVGDFLTTSELLAVIMAWQHDLCPVTMQAIKDFNVRCLAGRPPSEYLHALADRATEEARDATEYHYTALRAMARTLEAWADE